MPRLEKEARCSVQAIHCCTRDDSPQHQEKRGCLQMRSPEREPTNQQLRRKQADASEFSSSPPLSIMPLLHLSAGELGVAILLPAMAPCPDGGKAVRKQHADAGDVQQPFLCMDKRCHNQWRCEDISHQLYHGDALISNDCVDVLRCAGILRHCHCT